MNQLYVAIIDDLCNKLTAILLIPRESGDEPAAVSQAKESLTAARKALDVAGFYSK